MGTKKIESYPSYISSKKWVTENVPLKAEDEVEATLRMLDMIRGLGGVGMRTALAMLEDAKTILMEMTIV